MKSYKLDFLNIFFKFLIVSIVLNILFLLWSKTYDFKLSLLATFAIIVIEFLLFFISKVLIKIEIAEGEMKFYFRNLIIFKKVKTVSFNDSQYSYKEEVGAKGVKKEELRFYEKHKKIIGIGRGFDGWSEKIVFKIINDLKEKGITEIN